MKLQSLLQRYQAHPQLAPLWAARPAQKLQLQRLHGSGLSLVAAAAFERMGVQHLAILPDKEQAAYFYNDLVHLLGEQAVLFFPSSYKRSIQYQSIDSASIGLRTDVLGRLAQSNPVFVVSYPGALVEQVLSADSLGDNTLHLHRGEQIAQDDIVGFLSDFGFRMVDYVYEPGQFAQRGSILDVYSFAGDFPYRIDFFGNQIDSIRTFDPQTQLSVVRFEAIAVVPNIQEKLAGAEKVSFLSLFGPSTVVWVGDAAVAVAELDDTIQRVSPILVHTTDDELHEPRMVQAASIMLQTGQLQTELAARLCVEFGQATLFAPDVVLEFRTRMQPAFNKNFKLLTEHLLRYQQQGYQNYLLSDNENQFRRLADIFAATVRELDDPSLTGHLVQFEPLMPALHQGLIDEDLGIALLADHQIFDRYHKFKLKTRAQQAAKEALTLREINELQPGDYVVHTDYGIGRFGGLERVENNGRVQESIRLVYKDGDVVYASIHSLHRISKYKGKEGEPPTIHKIGSGVWQKQKAKAKSRIKDIAKELIELYAKRMQEQGFAFSADTYLQEELEASFLYEDTPDQTKATLAVKQDMESVHPMDRLVCGDVGFGKTEIAIRAAFKAATEGKQVAVLVPTTILALQHYRTFSKRLADFPVRVGYISRLRSAKEQKETLRDLERGQIDIIIGTHRLTGKDIRFKDLGLLVVDEEQKFGVSVKDKLKQLRVNVDTLTLTATPIPRTLQFSLMGARDLSVISTPPPNRFPVVTELHAFNEEIVREAISYEIERGGQVFFINNRVHNLPEIESLIRRLVPNVRTVYAHGQMEGAQLERIMLDFIEGDYDVLIATSIIESGLDIPNANTILINDAHHFGLSDLHQLRGRVGRTNRQAFCYLLAPPITTLTPEARRRLQAIEDFSDLGSGFNIALQDLDIRGAGNLLGGEQSGFIADIGYENYQRILNEAINELKENEFKELFADEKAARNDSLNRQFVNDCVVETDIELLLPEAYVSNTAERIRLYRVLDNLETESALVDFAQQLTDRFGPIPQQTQQLFELVRMRWLAAKIGIEKITIRNQTLILYFVSDPKSAYYQSPAFAAVLAYLQNNPKGCKMKEANNKLTLTIAQVGKIDQALAQLKRMLPAD